MLFPLRSWCGAAVTILLFLAASTLGAQERVGQESPRVERLTFRGVDAVAENELRQSIVTEETRCRGLIVRPFCWATDWDTFVDKHYLDRQELSRDELRVRVFYFRRGYREAEVATELRPRGRGVEVVFSVDEGAPTLIEALRVRQTAAVLSDRQLRRTGIPREGQPLDLVRLDTSLINLRETLGERGYLDALLQDSVDVDRTARMARVEITVDPRHRATVGDLEIRGNEQVADRTIRDALLLEEGRVLRTRDIVASQRSLYESNLFHEARVEVPEQPDSAKRLQVTVREAPPRSARVGAGFNTVEFVQTEGRFTHYNWLGRGRRLNLRGTVGNLLASQLNGSGIFRDMTPGEFSAVDEAAFLRPTWLASAELQQPAFRAASNTLGFSVFAHRRIVPAIVIDRGVGAEVALTRRLDYRSPASLGYRFEVTTVEAGDLYFCVNFGVCDLATISTLRQRQRLSPLELSFFTDRSDDPLAPTTGYTARLDIEHASGATLSDFRYNRITGAATHYIPFGVRHRRVLAGRVRAGWVRPLDTTAPALGLDEQREALLHPRKRFYSGGSRTVRGYGENQLGPRILTIAPEALRGLRDENGEAAYACPPAQEITTCDPNAEEIDVDDFQPRPLGGRSVLEANLEYRFPMSRQVNGAVFVDGAIVRGRGIGLVADGHAAVTPGFGVRYRSPVGPIRADLGIRPTLVETLPVVTEVVDEEGERRVIRVQMPRRYDPVGDAGRGIVGQVLGRLTLHLSIGEPF